MKTLTLIKTAIIIGALCIGSNVLLAQPMTQTVVNSANTTVPDGDPTGIASTIDVSGYAAGDQITQLKVLLSITGGYNGDLYAYLSGPGTGFAVLLNRVGVSSTDSFGYADAGFNIILDDNAANGNIHYYQNTSNPGGGQLTGTWAPDGEAVDPVSGAVGESSSSAMLASFMGGNPNGTWTLFVSDLSSGGEPASTLVSWGMTITTVPEPQAWAMGAMGALILLAGLNWRSKVG